jgi:hypothetical protein
MFGTDHLAVGFAAEPSMSLLGLGLQTSSSGFIFMTMWGLNLLVISIMMYIKSHLRKPTYTEGK